jgi:hypothetical protein
MGPRYVPTGHLILNRGTTLLAAPFDPTRLELTGPVVPVVERVAVRADLGRRPACRLASREPGVRAGRPGYALVLVEPDGRSGSCRKNRCCRIRGSPRTGGAWWWRQPAARATAGSVDARPREPGSPFEADLRWRSSARLDARRRLDHLLTPDPERTIGHLHRSADGRGDPREIVRLSSFHWLVGWTPERHARLRHDGGRGGRRRVPIVDLVVEERRVAPRRRAGRYVGWPPVPDGRWLAYYLRDSGYFEIYVTPFPDTGTRG